MGSGRLAKGLLNVLPILYSFRRCPYAIRARLALVYCGIRVELREVILKDKPESLLEYSPKGTVPVLVLENGSVIDESIDIVYWALALSDKANLLARLSADEFSTVKALIEENDSSFKWNLDRYKYADRYPDKPMEYYRQLAEEFLCKLESRLERSAFLMGDMRTVADISIFSFIRQFAFVDKAWFDQSKYINVQRWLAFELASDAFMQLMEKIPAWKPGQETKIFP